MAVWIALEGPDGCGKSTQAALLARFLETRGHRVLALREPGSTPVGEGLRQILLDPRSGELDPLTEALLFTAARRELVRTVIAPALREGTSVVADRCYLSTWVYQGLAADSAVPQALLEAVTAAAHAEAWPDRIVVLDVPVELSVKRRGRRPDDRMEAKGPSFHARVRDGYRALAAAHPRCRLVDASATHERVYQAVLEALRDLPEVSP